MVEEHTAPFLLPSPEKPLPPPLVRLERRVGRLWRRRRCWSASTCASTSDDRIGLLGVNGAGKSTFARLMAGDLPPISGKHAPRPAA